MKKFLLLLTIFTLMIFTLSGCGNKTESPDEPEPEKTANANVTVDYPAEEEDMENYIHFTEPRYEGSEFLTTLVIKTDQKISEFKVYDVEPGDASQEVKKYFIKDVVYELDTLTPEKPIVFGTVFPDFTAHHAISYKDTDGTEQIFSITMSGNDNSIVLNPSEFEEGPMPVQSANVAFDFASDEKLSSYPDHHVFSDPVYNNPDYQTPVLITTDSVITDFKIMNAEPGEATEDETFFIPKETLFELDQLEPDKPLLFNTEFPGSVPSRIVSYTDADGSEKVFSVSISGNDGLLLVLPVSLTE